MSHGSFYVDAGGVGGNRVRGLRRLDSQASMSSLGSCVSDIGEPENELARSYLLQQRAQNLRRTDSNRSMFDEMKEDEEREADAADAKRKLDETRARLAKLERERSELKRRAMHAEEQLKQMQVRCNHHPATTVQPPCNHPATTLQPGRTSTGRAPPPATT